MFFLALRIEFLPLLFSKAKDKFFWDNIFIALNAILKFTFPFPITTFSPQVFLSFK